MDYIETDTRTSGEEATEAENAPLGPIMVCMADVAPRDVDWLWPGRIAIGKITLLFGNPGLGKSFVTVDMAARVSTGAQWPDGQECPMGDVILMNAEDDAADTIRPRLDAAGADVNLVHTIEGVRCAAGGGKTKTLSLSLADIPTFEEALKRNPDTKLVVIDPVSAFLEDADSHKNAEIRALLAPLSKLASKHRVAIVLVTHMNKTTGGRALNRAMGSMAFAAAARAAWLIVEDGTNPRRRLFLPTKNNLALDTDGLAYCIEGEGKTAHVQWESGPVATRADEALAAMEPDPKTSPKKKEAAEEWLKQALENGPVPKTEIERQAKDAGMAWGTVRRAQGELGIVPQKSTETFNGPWMWALPEAAQSEHAQ